MRYLANKEELVQRVSDSYLMRRAAQIAVSVFYRTKTMAEQQKLTDLSPEKFRSFLDKFQNNIKEEIEHAKKDLESKTKR